MTLAPQKTEPLNHSTPPLNLTNTKEVTILCPLCGIRFNPSKGNICNTCILGSTDITKNIGKDGVLSCCRDCKRWERPPWINCERQSKQLLSICLSKIKGLSKMKLVSAYFLWTEPHSRRIKVKLTISQDVNNTSEIFQTTIVEFYEQYTQCPDCKKQYTPHKFESVVQIRQHVQHKKTFLHLEQQIIKNKAHEHVMKVQETVDGMNFYFKQNMHAQKMVEFLTSILPVRVKTSKQLISEDFKNWTAVFDFTHSVQIPKICKDDIVLIHPKLAKMLGGCGLMLLCYKVTTYLYMIDLSNFRTLTISKQQYELFQHKFDILPFNKFKSQFQVLDSEPITKQNLNQTFSNLLDHKLYQTIVTRTTQWQEIMVKCHLGQLQAGQKVEGYDLRYLQYNEHMNSYPGVQEIILVRRVKDPEKKRKRQVKVKRLEDEGIVVEVDEKKKKNKKEADVDPDFQQFLDELQQRGELNQNNDKKLQDILQDAQEKEHKQQKNLQRTEGQNKTKEQKQQKQQKQEEILEKQL